MVNIIVREYRSHTLQSVQFDLLSRGVGQHRGGPALMFGREQLVTGPNLDRADYSTPLEGHATGVPGEPFTSMQIRRMTSDRRR